MMDLMERATFSTAGTVRVRRLMSVREVCSIVGVSERTVRRWLAEGKLPCYRVMRVVRISLDDLNSFLAAHREPAG